MWKAIIKSVEADSTPSVAKVAFVYSEGKRTKEVLERISNPTSIKRIAQNAIDELNRIDMIKELVEKPTLGEIDFTPPAPPDTSKDYNFQRQALITMKQDLDLGIVSQADYDKQLELVISLK